MKKKKRKSVAYDLTLLVLTGKMRCFEAVLSRVSIYLYTSTLFTIKWTVLLCFTFATGPELTFFKPDFKCLLKNFD